MRSKAKYDALGADISLDKPIYLALNDIEPSNFASKISQRSKLVLDNEWENLVFIDSENTKKTHKAKNTNEWCLYDGITWIHLVKKVRRDGWVYDKLDGSEESFLPNEGNFINLILNYFYF